MAANPILYFHPDGFQVARADLKGRHSAGESFLSAYMAQTPHAEIYALCDRADDFREFETMVAASDRPLRARQVSRTNVAALRELGLLNLPDPTVAEAARVRGFLGDMAYALCGVTHTISSRAIVDAVAGIATAPVMPWDAVILTSRAVAQAVAVVLDHAEEELRARVGAQRFTRPMLPVIPLGTHSQRFKRNEADRARWRKHFKLADDTIALLFFGRLSVHAKASPFQLAQAVEQAAQSGGERYAVIWCGWFSDDFQRRVFMETARRMAPSVEFHHVDGRATDARFSIWSAADIFCSLSDNIQETFGLTVIEAMAAELPVIVSNWDGYRDTVKHGETGVLVDSYMPDSPLTDLAYRYIAKVDTYDHFIGGISQFCFVNVEQTAQWVARLGKDENLRRTLGTAARKSVEAEFDWTAVLPRYQALWDAQRERLDQARREGQPMRRTGLDPTKMFAHFSSHRLDADARLDQGPNFGRWTDIANEPGILIHGAVLMSETEFRAVRDQIAAGACALGQLLAAAKVERRDIVLRSLHWMVKVGLLRVVKG